MRPRKPDAGVRRSLGRRWCSLISRCQDENHPRFKDYGFVGVTICEQWLDKENFLTTARELPGYDEELLLAGKLHLDKDLRVPGNKIYSPDTCAFVTLEENNKCKPNQMKAITAISPSGDIHEFTNQSDFAKSNLLRQSSISDCLSGKLKTHAGWKFKYSE